MYCYATRCQCSHNFLPDSNNLECIPVLRKAALYHLSCLESYLLTTAALFLTQDFFLKLLNFNYFALALVYLLYNNA